MLFTDAATVRSSNGHGYLSLRQLFQHPFHSGFDRYGVISFVFHKAFAPTRIQRTVLSYLGPYAASKISLGCDRDWCQCTNDKRPHGSQNQDLGSLARTLPAQRFRYPTAYRPYRIPHPLVAAPASVIIPTFSARYRAVDTVLHHSANKTGFAGVAFCRTFRTGTSICLAAIRLVELQGHTPVGTAIMP